MLDLPTLGRELRAQRRSLRIPSAELARRIGVSPTYIWLIEHAKPRSNGEPSRPSDDLLRRWTSATGMIGSQTREMRELAGYFGSDIAYERHTASETSSEMPVRSLATESDATGPDDAGGDLAHRNRTSRCGHAASISALRQWAGTEGIDGGDEAMVERLQFILLDADRNGRGEEVRSLVTSFLSWLRFHANRTL
jgi:transcriptional regulator with XRE-family HTH domain